MKISIETIESMNHMPKLGDVLYVDGNELAAQNKDKTFICVAKVPDSFPAFGIHEPKRFLNTLGLLEDPEWEFVDENKRLIIYEDGYTFENPLLDLKVYVPPSKDRFQNIRWREAFSLSPQQMKTLKKASSLPPSDKTISFVGNGKNISISAPVREKRNGNVIRNNVLKWTFQPATEIFDISFNAKALKHLPVGECKVAVCNEGAVKFTYAGDMDMICYVTDASPEDCSESLQAA